MNKENIEEKMEFTPSNTKYSVETCRDKEMLMDFIKFYNRVKHPRSTFNIAVVGALFLVLPRTLSMATVGAVISYIAGAIIVLFAFLRPHITLATMKDNPEFKLGEKVVYQFGNSGIRVTKDGKIDTMGHYKDVWRVWEDERNYYVGLNNDDLIVLPTKDFVEGDVSEFKYYMIDKTGVDYVWLPFGMKARMKQLILNTQKKFSAGDENAKGKKKED